MLGSAQRIRFQSFEERLARERNGGIEPYLDLVEHSDSAGLPAYRIVEDDDDQDGGLIRIQPEENKPPRRGRRPVITSE